MSINTFTKCVCDRCPEYVELAGPLPHDLPPPRWMRVTVMTTKKGKEGLSASEETRVLCPSCAALIDKALTPVNRKKRS